MVRVLLIEDDPAISDITRYFLSAQPGYSVTVERVSLDDTGLELSREVVSEDRYEPTAATVYVGVAVR